MGRFGLHTDETLYLIDRVCTDLDIYPDDWNDLEECNELVRDRLEQDDVDYYVEDHLYKMSGQLSYDQCGFLMWLLILGYELRADVLRLMLGAMIDFRHKLTNAYEDSQQDWVPILDNEINMVSDEFDIVSYQSWWGA